MSRRPLVPLVLLLGSSLAMGATAAAEAPLAGFTEASAARQRELERRFDGKLDAANLRAWMERLSARPHHVGSPHGRANAEFMAGLLRSWGWDTRIETFHVLFPVPRVRRLELLAPTRFVATLGETPLAEDRTSGQAAEQLPPYNAYSIDGDVTGELVYVNRGVPDDYDELDRRGIDVRGKIVIARYGGSWRGIKPKVAAEKGAIGCILYSDPRDDGYFVGDPYPGGGWRPEQGVQRGSVADMPLFPGDPLTPFVAAMEDAERLPLEAAPTLTKIPVLPISHGDALPLLRALTGPVAPESWRGALPLTYHLGPGPARVRLTLEFDWTRAPAHDVIAVLRGTDHPEQWILRGNHHDAWVNGATDPISGMVAVLEEARVIGELAREGHRPKRTLVYAAWDAEEPGLIGSTEWVERHADELRDKAVAYVNSDSNSRGFLRVGGSHTLERFVNAVAAEVPDPRLDVSVAERARARLAVRGNPDRRKQALEGGDLPLAPLGSGSDYTPFLQHLGIASLDVRFGGEGHYGQYHSAYDSFDHYRRFMDPDFRYGVTLARVGGRIVLRLANADVLPFEFAALVSKVETYAGEVIELADKMREETRTRNRMIEQRAFALAADPEQAFVPPPRQEPVPHLEFAPLRNAIEKLKHSSGAFTQAAGSAASLPAERRRRLDAVLMRAERALTHPQGLPRRPWFVHYVYAPGFYTGYGVKTLPAVREAIEQRRWDEAGRQIQATAGVLERFAAEIDRACAILAE